MRALLLLVVCAFMGLSGAYAQSVRVTGKVTDVHGSIVGATVIVKGNPTIGASTDINGDYQIMVPSKESSLIFSFVGYKPQTVMVGDRTIIDVVLKEDLTEMEEVVVVGYGTQKKKFVLGAVSQVGNEELTRAPMSNISNMMTGKLPGVTARQSSGMPGNDGANILIRGTNTFAGASPLILVDGVERMLDMVNPADIENISILKDGATSAVYGMKAMNGVILITTKQGATGATRITYNGSVTFSKNTAFPKFLDGPDYLHWYNKARILDNQAPAFDAEIQTKVLNGDPNGVYANTDWFDLLFKNYGLNHQHNISATGGTDKVKYYASIGLMDQNGIVKNVDYKRYNIRSNVDAILAKGLSFTLGLGGFYEDRNWPGLSFSKQAYMNPITQAIYAIPIIAPTYQGKPMAWSENGDVMYNPVAAVENSGFQRMQRWSFEGSGKLQYDFSTIKPLRGLKFSMFMAYDFSNTWSSNFLADYKMMVYNKATRRIDESRASGVGDGSFDKSSSNWDRLQLRPTLEYGRTFGKHSVNILALYEQMESHGSTMTGRKQGYYFNYPVDISIGQRFPDDATGPVTGSFTHAARKSYVARLNYAFDQKYLLEVAARWDGDVAFGPDNRWGTFPSVSLGWIMSEENFFQRALPMIEMFKLRGSFARLGLNDLGGNDFLWMSAYQSTNKPAYVFGGTAYNALFTTNSIVSDLSWATSNSYNIGFELSAWNGMLGVEFDYFYKYVNGIQEATGATYPSSLGGNYPTREGTGRLDNRGCEIVLRHRNHIGKDWRYAVTGHFSYAKNRILSRIQSAGTSAGTNVIGRSVGQIYGYKAIGLFQTQEQLDNAPLPPSGYMRLGDIMYEDLNGDGRIDSRDKTCIGYGTTPRMNFALDLNVSWKNISLSALFQGAAQVDYQLSATYNTGTTDATAFTRPFYENGNAPYYLVENSWTPENRNAKYPRLSTAVNGNNAWPSTWWVVNGNYLRLKNLQLAYSLPKSVLDRWNAGISGVDLYLAGTNLLTFTSFKYADPEMPSVNNGYYPQQKTYSIGLNVTF